LLLRRKNTKTNAEINYEEVFHPLKAELNPICHLLALLEANHILHVGRVNDYEIENFFETKYLKNICRPIVQERTLKSERL